MHSLYRGGEVSTCIHHTGEGRSPHASTIQGRGGLHMHPLYRGGEVSTCIHYTGEGRSPHASTIQGGGDFAVEKFPRRDHFTAFSDAGCAAECTRRREGTKMCLFATCSGCVNAVLPKILKVPTMK